MAVPIKKLNVSLIKRNAIKRGPTSSDAWNDSFEEAVNDLSRITTQWNDSLYPLLATIPDGTNDLDAYTDGLDGRTLLVDSTAVSTVSNTTYFNIADDRPNNVKEQFGNVYTTITQLQQNLEAQISNAGGALTDAQKNSIGANIFDSLSTSSASSLDGKSENSRLNIIQVARDMYGPSFSLNDNGTATLTNSVMAMVDALLELHNGNWSSDITLNHSDAFDSSGLLAIDGSNAMTGQLKLDNGLVTVPALSFTSDPNTGIYRSAEGQIAFASNSVQLGKFDGTTGALLVNKIRQNSGAELDIRTITEFSGLTIDDSNTVLFSAPGAAVQLLGGGGIVIGSVDPIEYIDLQQRTNITNISAIAPGQTLSFYNDQYAYLPEAGSPILSLNMDSVDLENGLLTGKYFDAKTYSSPPSGIQTTVIDWSRSTYHTKTLEADTVFTFSNERDGQEIKVLLTNTASGWDVTWPGSVKWTGAAAPLMTSGVKTDIYTFLKVTDIYGSYEQNYDGA